MRNVNLYNHHLQQYIFSSGHQNSMAPIIELLRSQSKRLLRRDKNRSSAPDGRSEKLSNDVAEIQRQAGRLVSIASTVTPENLHICHSQDQSPLFALPAEIRTLIYAYALSPDPWQDSFDTQLFRPTDRYSTHILQTCRRVWLEANACALDQARPELFLYRSGPFGDDGGGTRGIAELVQFMQKLTTRNKERIRLTINADMEVLTREKALTTFAVYDGPWPERVTLKLRFRRYVISQVVKPGVDPDGVEEVVAEMLGHAVKVGIKRFTLNMQAPVEQRGNLEETVRRLSTDGVHRSGWVFDNAACRIASAEDGEGDDRFDVAVLQWLRDGADERPDQQTLQELAREADVDPQHVRIRERQEKRAETYLQHWQTQGSLLHFDE